MMVGHCQTHPHHHHQHQHQHYHQHHQHSVQRAGSESSSSTRDEQFSNSGTNRTTSSSSNNGPPSEYSLTLSSEAGDRSRHLSTASLLDSIERRTQRTYRYGIGLVCVGATLNWLGFAQGTTYIDPLRYLGVACVLTGSFCVCLAMCRWLGRPISVSGHHVTNLEEERSNGDVHVINVAVPMYVPSLQEDYRPTKPPDYEQIVANDPPPYDEAIKLSPGAFINGGGLALDGGHLYASHFNSSAPCQASPSHLSTTHTTSTDLTRALLLDNEHEDTSYRTTPSHRQLALLGDSDDMGGGDPPPAYEPSPRSSISSCSSSAPLIPTSTSRFELPPSFAVRRLFGGGGSGSIAGTHTPPSIVPAENSSSSLYSTPHSSPRRIFNMNEHLHEIIIEDSVVQNAYLPVSNVDLSNTNNINILNNRDERIV